jgi:hypothetical protein
MIWSPDPQAQSVGHISMPIPAPLRLPTWLTDLSQLAGVGTLSVWHAEPGLPTHADPEWDGTPPLAGCRMPALFRTTLPDATDGALTPSATPSPGAFFGVTNGQLSLVPMPGAHRI